MTRNHRLIVDTCFAGFVILLSLLLLLLPLLLLLSLPKENKQSACQHHFRKCLLINSQLFQLSFVVGTLRVTIPLSTLHMTLMMNFLWKVKLLLFLMSAQYDQENAILIVYRPKCHPTVATLGQLRSKQKITCSISSGGDFQTRKSRLNFITYRETHSSELH